METGISFTEFSYMLLQAYDFSRLYAKDGVTLQLGGSDQWGNITAGIELIGKKDGAEVHGLTLPLLTTASGAKFGKSEGGNVWLDPARTSPYAFYQFWINQDDRDAERLLRSFTFLSLPEIAAIMAEHARAPERRQAQKVLAEEMTRRVHGEEAVAEAQRAAETLFGAERRRGGGAELDPAALLAAEMPELVISSAEFGEGMPLVDVLLRAGLASSKADARRGIEGRGFYLNNEPIGDVGAKLERSSLAEADGVGVAVLRKGKKNYVRVVVR